MIHVALMTFTVLGATSVAVCLLVVGWMLRAERRDRQTRRRAREVLASARWLPTAIPDREFRRFDERHP